MPGFLGAAVSADKCRPVIVRDVDGNEITTRVHGGKAMTPHEVALFGELVRAAQARFRAEHGDDEEATDGGRPDD